MNATNATLKKLLALAIFLIVLALLVSSGVLRMSQAY